MNYQKIYLNIIKKAKSQNRIRASKYKRKKYKIDFIYYENHHIIPKCLGGTDEETNLVLLTAKEHFICHKLLTYIYKGNRKIAYAFHRMAFSQKENRKISSRDYSYAIELIKTTFISEETRKKMKGKTPWNKGKTNVYDKGVLENWSRKKLGNQNGLGNKSNTGKKFSEEHKDKIRKKHIGLKPSEETRKKLANKAKQRKKYKCEYCNKEINRMNYVKWHGEKCKLKST